MENFLDIFFDVLQYCSLVFAILTIYFTIKRSILNKHWTFDVPIIILMLHGVVYYLVLIATKLHLFSTPHLFFTSWSSALRFHGYVTLCMIALVNYLREEKKWSI